MLQTGRRALTNHTVLRVLYPSSANPRRGTSVLAGSQDAPLLPSGISDEGHASIARAGPAPKLSMQDDYTSLSRQQKYDDLLNSLRRDESNPTLTWTYYVDLLDFTRDERLPLEIHQAVLRRCTPDARKLRYAYAVALRERWTKDTPHNHEVRFLTIMNNIRRDGYNPTLDDYEFILSQFAAVGHFLGAAQVLQEVVGSQLERRTRTFGLCLQAIAYRLTLPCPESEQEKLREECSQLCLHIVGLIKKRKRRVPSACLDLALRIMKDTDNEKIFSTLLRIAYNIDLDYLDRHPLASDGASEPEPFSTSALTTVVDFFGRQKQPSKMIAAFEVLTTPLKVGPSEIQSQNFKDEEDDDYFVPDKSSSRPLPSARPNITTINTLIRHCTRLNKTALAKHYVLQALELDYAASVQLQIDIQSIPFSSIRPPDVLVNVDTFRPILGLVNRDHDLALVKWVLPHFRMALRRKKLDLQYYSEILKHPEDPIPQPAYPRFPDGLRAEYGLAGPASSNSSSPEDALGEMSVDASGESPSTFFTPSSSPLSSTSHPTLILFDDQMPQDPLDVNLESPPSQNETRSKLFDLALHVQVLQRDVLAMNELDDRIGSAISRLCIRLKEALGRRVWAGKAIYLRDVDRRVVVSREDWMDMVNFGGAATKAVSPATPGTPDA